MLRAACDDEIVSLACQRGTSISIQVAAYRNTAPQGQSCMAEIVDARDIAVVVDDSEKCLLPNSMQVSYRFPAIIFSVPKGVMICNCTSLTYYLKY